MKRIYLFMTLFVAFAANAVAQRNVDFQVDFVSPTTATVVNPGNGTFNIDVVIKNNGPDNFNKATDSMQWYAKIQGSKISFDFGGGPGTDWLQFNFDLKKNDTIHQKFPGIRFPNYAGKADSMRELCWYVMPKGSKTDVITDPAPSSNTKCVKFLFKAVPVNVPSVANAKYDVKVYPNPAVNAATVAFDITTPEKVRVNILDMTGRIVSTVDRGLQQPGEQVIDVNVAGLQAGMYVYQVFVGTEVTTGRFAVGN